MINRFLKKNRKFWSQFPAKNSGKKLLIEEPGRIYMKAIFSMIINQAKGYIPVWLCENNSQLHQLIRSYFPDAEITLTEKKWLPKKIYAAIVAFFKFIKIFFTKNILGFHYDGVKYGDIIYDMYLEKRKVATIKKIDFTILKLIATYIFRHIKIKTILQNGNYAGVLVSHMIGSAGVMLRSALRYGYEGYLCSGVGPDLVAFQRFKTLGDIIYPHKPSPSGINQIIRQLEPGLEKVFLKILKQEIIGKGGVDSLNAFSKKNKLYTNRAFFNRDYKLNPNKKNVFVMLHAFNDHPHSHFHWMIFKDYYDWFVQTLKFAKKNNKVNWIFKQHPLIRWYPVKDVNFKKLFSGCPDNIVFIDENEQINTRSLIYCADLIVTCLSSAGFELPAMAAIPSITASDNHYAGLGFALEPKTKKEYFDLLNKAEKIKKLNSRAQKRAQATYIYAKKISKIKLSIRPPLAIRGIGEKNKNIQPEYWKKALNQYTANKKVVLKELNCYIQAIKEPGFKKLTTKI